MARVSPKNLYCKILPCSTKEIKWHYYRENLKKNPEKIVKNIEISGFCFLNWLFSRNNCRLISSKKLNSFREDGCFNFFGGHPEYTESNYLRFTPGNSMIFKSLFSLVLLLFLRLKFANAFEYKMIYFCWLVCLVNELKCVCSAMS